MLKWRVLPYLLLLTQTMADHHILGPCEPSLCLNGGTCVLGTAGSSEKCDCPRGFSGMICQIDNRPHLHATCYSTMTAYADHTKLIDPTTAGATSPNNISHAGVPLGTETITIKCEMGVGDTHGGILASISDGTITDRDWVCTTNDYTGIEWYSPDLDTSSWQPAFAYRTNGDPPTSEWNIQPDIASNAQWIWRYRSATGTIYCRKDFRPCGRVFGEPHIGPFDWRRYYDLHGTCTYMYSELCQPGDGLVHFRVMGQHAEENSWQTRRGVSVLQTAIIQVYGRTIKINHYGGIEIDGVPVSYPKNFTAVDPSFPVTIVGPRPLGIKTEFGLRARFTTRYNFELKLPQAYRGRVCGLLGNADGDPSNDQQLRNGDLTTDLVALAKEYKVPEFSRPKCVDHGTVPAVCDSESDLRAASTKCLPLIAPFGIFRPCHNVASPSLFFDACLYDMCFDPLNEPLFCANLAVYAETCEQLGVVINWRSTYLGQNCPSCGAHAHYAAGVSRCPNTCAEPNATANCPDWWPTTSRCECDEGYILSSDTCVLPSDCGCTESGNYYQVGESWWRDCPSNCTCVGLNNVTCSSLDCFPFSSCHNVTHTCQCVEGYEKQWDECVPINRTACARVYNDPQYVTFDRCHDWKRYLFHGTCTYVLSQLCDPGATDLVPFTVFAENAVETPHQASNRVSVPIRAIVAVDGRQIEILRNQVIVDSEIVTPPRWYNNSDPTRTGSYIHISVKYYGFLTLNTDFGLEILFRPNRLKINLRNSSYSGKLCGMLGDWDGNPDNEYRLRNGSLTEDVNAFGNDWKEPKFSRPLCVDGGEVAPGCNTTQAHDVALAKCAVMSYQYGIFRRCYSLVNPTRRVDSCVYDMCRDPDNDALYCYHLAEYADSCEQLGVVVDWMSTGLGNNCPPCPANAHHEAGAVPCVNTCANPTAAETCEPSRPTISGCMCDEGFLLAGMECLPPEQCGCMDGGNLYQIGAKWSVSCELFRECVGHNDIQGTEVQCTFPRECVLLPDGTSTCRCVKGFNMIKGDCVEKPSKRGVIWGDPHYETFDGRHFTYMGNCTFVTTEFCDEETPFTPWFRLTTKHSYYDHWWLEFYAISIVRHSTLQLYGHTITLMQPIAGIAIVNGETITNPVVYLDGPNSGNFIHITTEGYHSPVIRTDFGLTVVFLTRLGLSVYLPGRLQGRVCGMLGDGNCDPSNDYRLRNGTIVGNALVFGKDWMEPSLSPTGCVATGHWIRPCQDRDADWAARAKCRLLYITFAPCMFVVSHVPFWKACYFDMCVDITNEKLFCADVEMYAQACAERGVFVDWRKDNLCQVQCVENAHYELTTSGCSNTCVNPAASETCDLPDVSNCVCNDGFFLSGSQCVPSSECGCLVAGRYIEKGEKLWQSQPVQCDTLCECTNGPFAACRTANVSQCPSGTVCQQLPNVSVAQCICVEGTHRNRDNCSEIECPPSESETCNLAETGELCPSSGEGHFLVTSDSVIIAERGDHKDRCWVKVVVNTTNEGIMKQGVVGLGIHPIDQESNEIQYVYNLNNSLQLWEQGFMVDTQLVTTGAIWTNGKLCTNIQQTNGGYRLSVSCDCQPVIQVEFGQLADRDVDVTVTSTTGWAAECYS